MTVQSSMQNVGLPPGVPALKPAAALVSAPLIEAYAAWCVLKGDRLAPCRRDIQPKAFKAVLPEAFLLDVIDKGADYRFVLGGDKLVRFLFGRLSPGMKLSTVSGSLFYERATRALGECVRARAPLATGPSRATLRGRELHSAEVLMMPLSDDGISVTSVFGAIHLVPLPLDFPPTPVDPVPAF